MNAILQIPHKPLMLVPERGKEEVAEAKKAALNLIGVHIESLTDEQLLAVIRFLKEEIAAMNSEVLV